MASQKNAWVGGYIQFANLRSGVLFFGDIKGKEHVFAGYPCALDSLKRTPYVRIKLCTYKFLICILINNMVKRFSVQSLLRLYTS